MGIFVWEKRVPFVTSSIQGSRGRPGRLIDHEKYGTDDKNNEDEKSVKLMEHKFCIGKFPPGKWDYLFKNSVYSGTLPVEQTQSCVPFISQPEFLEFFGKWKMLNVLL